MNTFKQKYVLCDIGNVLILKIIVVYLKFKSNWKSTIFLATLPSSPPSNRKVTFSNTVLKKKIQSLSKTAEKYER